MAVPYSDAASSCAHTISLNDFTHIAVGPALFLILILSVLEKRRKARRCRCCGDRPGLLVPVNLLDGDEDRLAYAAAFGSTASNCLTLFQGGYITEHTPMWSQVLLAMVAVTEMGIDFYPFFACLGKQNSIVWSFVGLAYSVIWFLVNLGHVFECIDDSEWVFTGEPIMIQLPVLTCLLYLVLTFLWRFMSAVLAGFKYLAASSTDDVELLHVYSDTNAIKAKAKFQLSRSHQCQHVTELLMGVRSSLPSVEMYDSSVWSILSYRQDPTFRFSPRITATVTVTLLCLYELGLMSFLSVEKLLIYAREAVHSSSTSADIATVVGPDGYRHVDLFLSTVKMCWYVAFGISSSVILKYIIDIFISYKIQMKRLIRGDHSYVPKHCVELPGSKILAHSLMYSGSQIAYILWGYVVMTSTLFCCGMLLAYLVILPLLGLVPDILLKPFYTLLPTFIVSYIVYYLQIFISRKILLQNVLFCNSVTHEKRKCLALDNRRVYHNVSYFLFFYHILLGLYTCLVRVGKGILLGVVFLGRIDRSGLVKGFEHWDTGYLSFVSYLQMEETHIHPVLVTFCQVLLDAARTRQLERHVAVSQMELMSSERSVRVTTRWLKAYTLINNPSLRPDHQNTDLKPPSLLLP